MDRVNVAPGGDLKAALFAAGKRNRHRTWLVIYPASGTVVRMTGALVLVNLGGESKWTPFVIPGKGSRVTALDPRALVLDDETLEHAYHPRDHVGEMHAAGDKWYADNPHVFATRRPAELDLLATGEN
jgi:hypothetical protein